MIYCISWSFGSERFFCRSSSSSQAAANFGDQDIIKCLNNLFLVVERADWISLAVLVTYNVAYVINRESYLKGVTISRS